MDFYHVKIPQRGLLTRKKNYIAKLTQDSSNLQLKTSVANAQSLIDSGKIVEDLGRVLSVTDIGGGYVSITLTPETTLGTVIMVN